MMSFMTRIDDENKNQSIIKKNAATERKRWIKFTSEEKKRYAHDADKRRYLLDEFNPKTVWKFSWFAHKTFRDMKDGPSELSFHSHGVDRKGDSDPNDYILVIPDFVRSMWSFGPEVETERILSMR